MIESWLETHLEFNSLSQMYQITSEEEDQAIQRYLRLPYRKENEPQRKQLKDECQMYKKKFHQVNEHKLIN